MVSQVSQNRDLGHRPSNFCAAMDKDTTADASASLSMTMGAVSG